MSSYSKLTIQQKANQASYLKRWRQARRKPFVSILDLEVLPPIRTYKKREVIEHVENDDMDEDTDDNASVMTDITDCSLIGTTYKKTPHLKELDNALREKLYDKGYDTQDKVANLFSTLLNVNKRYGLPILEQRSEPRLEQFYKDTIINLG